MKLALRLTLLNVAMLLFTFNARAGSITEDQARAKAQSFLQNLYQSTNGKRLAAARTPAELYSTSTGESSLYVFNIGDQDGFVIVSGDDRVRPILGYTDSGTFDADKAPAALREMMAIYVRQIESLGQTKTSTDSIASASNSRRRISGAMADVSPLLTTTWNQTAPYNNYCPTLNDQTALTGCVATAMAQIAYYHKYPTTQVPSLSAYTSTTNAINVSAWGATTFDWDNMLTSYDGSETSTQIAAVATLMRYCGQAAQMDYGFSSGAYNGDARYALVNKLGYDDGATFKSASAYTTDGWEDLIYKEVHEGRPVYYSALNGDENGAQCGGHAFVIDGYKADGNYFHVNWGWSGYADGYFNLFALDPSAPEWDATATGWHYQMLALVGLSPEAVNIAKLTQDASGSWLITSADDWNELSTNLGAYNGGSFKLTNDISVTTMVGTESQPFSGTFDGQGHTLNVNIVTDQERTGTFHWARHSTFKNIVIDGTFTTSNHGAGGLVGWAQDVTIINCESKITINSNYQGDGTCGGFICLVRDGGSAYLYDCVFTGLINGPNLYYCGGLCGWQDNGAYFYNCLNLGRIEIASNEDCASFCRNGASLSNCYYVSSLDNALDSSQGISVTTDQLSDGSIAHALQSGQRDWTTGMVWGQLLGSDAVPVLTADAGMRVNKVSFAVDGQVLKTVFCNSTVGDKMPEGEDFGLTNAMFTCAGATFSSMTPVTSDITVTVTGTPAFTLTLNTPTNGTITINNSSCVPGTLKKITAAPASGYVVSSVTATDASGNVLPVTQVSNARNEFVFAFPKSSVTVNATFAVGEAEAVRFINEGMTLPCWWDGQTWTADTWTIWSYDDQPTIGTPPTDAFGHQWYEEGYVLTNGDDDFQPNDRPIVWENHTAPFGNYRNYDYARDCGGNGGPNNFYFRRVFTFNTEIVPEKLYLVCYYDDAPVEIYLNGTLIYSDSNHYAGSYSGELTSDQIALIHTDGTPNVLAARGSQGGGDYYLDCGLYDPTALIYAVTGESKVRVTTNHVLSGDVVIPETVTYDGVTYTVTAIDDEATNDLPYLTSMSLPTTITSIGTNVFVNDPNLLWVKAYFPVYQKTGENTLVAAPTDATEYVLPEDCQRIWNNAFKFTDKLQTLTLPRSLTEIRERAFSGCTALKDIYAYPRTVPNTRGNAFDGIVKTGITVHVFESALDSYKESWGEDFTYVTMTDPQTITLTINVTEQGTLATLISEAAADMASTAYDVTGITVTGSINQDDLSALAAMCTGVYNLANIDLSGAAIADNYIGHSMFSDKEKLVSIVLPETLEYINESAFYNCDGLTAIDIPASVKRIWSRAFSQCDNLTTVSGLEGLSVVGFNFYEIWDVFNWTAITEPVYGGDVFLYLPPTATGEYEVPAGIKVFTCDAMRDARISSVILPASVTDLGNDVFRGCSNLKDIFIYATVPPTCHDGSMEYDYDKSQSTLHVPVAALETYQTANEWREFGTIVPMATYDLIVNVTTPGTFISALAEAMEEADITTVQAISMLTVTGTLNDADLEDLAAVGTQNSYVDIRSPYTIVSGSQLIAVATTATELTYDNSLSTIHNFAFAGCEALNDIYFTNKLMVPSLPTNAFGDEDKSAVTLHVYESYLNHFQSLWGNEFTYVTMDDPDDLVVIFTDEPLYLYNVEAGLYFCASNSYGTQASLGAEPMEVTLEAGPDGSYIIKTLGGNDELFMEGNTCYVDRMDRDRDYYWELMSQEDGTFLIRMAESNPHGSTPSNYPGMYFGRNDLEGTWLTHLVDISDANAQIHWRLDYLSDVSNIEIAEADYAALCTIYDVLGGDSWTKQWDISSVIANKNAWPGVVINDEGRVTAIDLSDNNVRGDISTLDLKAFIALKSLNLSNNALTGDIQTLVGSLPTGCTLNVERQELGYIGEYTLYDVCRFSQSDDVLPTIAFHNSQSGTLASSLIGVGGYCQFYHKGIDGGHYWDSYIFSDGGTINNFKFYWPSPTTVECLYPHHFTFTYTYSMGDANMDDALNVLDLQTTLNYSNNQSSGLFNFYAADTYGPDDDINVQDIVATVNILLAQEESGDKDAKHRSNANTLGTTDADDNEAHVCVENGQLVLYTTRPVAAIEMRLAGIDPDQLHWCTDEMGFMTASMSQVGGTHAIIYSMSPREIAVGRTVLAEFDANTHTLSPYDVVLSDSMAHRINVGMSIPAGIVINKENMTGISVHDLLGRKLSDSQLRQGLYIVNGRKVIIK